METSIRCTESKQRIRVEKRQDVLQILGRIVAISFRCALVESRATRKEPSPDWLSSEEGVRLLDESPTIHPGVGYPLLARHLRERVSSELGR